MPSSFQALGIRSDHEAAELERDLGIKFSNFTPEDRETWILQSVYLEIFSKTRVVSLAADDAGVSIRTARQWQTDNTLGFNQRLEIAVLRYTDVLEVMLLQRAQQPDAPPSLLMMLLRAHMPEKYGSARRSSAPRDDNNACSHDHDPQPSTTSQYDRELLEAIFQDLQNLKQFTGLSEPDHMPIHPDTNPSPIDPTSVGAGFKPAPDLAQTEEENPTHSNLSPDLSPMTKKKTLLTPISPPTEERHREGALPHPTTTPPPSMTNNPATSRLPTPRTSIAANAANSNAVQTGKNLTSPAPPTRHSRYFLL